MMELLLNIYLIGCIFAFCFNAVYYIFFYKKINKSIILRCIELIASSFIISVISWFGVFVILIAMSVVYDNELGSEDDISNII